MEDLPQDLFAAIDHANMILNWHENRPSDEIPPRWMWPFDEELEAWFKRVDEEKKRERNKGSTDEESGGGMVQNQLARGRGADG